MGDLNIAFKGKGSLVGFVGEVVRLFKAFNSAEVIVPIGSTGKEPTLRIIGEKLVLDMTELNLPSGGSGSGDSQLPDYSAGTEGMVLQLDSTISPVWDFVRLVSPPTP